MAAYRVTDAQLTALADAIRAKGGTEDPLLFPGGFLQAIGAIEAGGGGASSPPGYSILIGTATVTPPEVEDEEEEEVVYLSVSDVPFTVEAAAVWHTAAHNTHYYTRGDRTLLFGFGNPSGTGGNGLCYNYPIVGAKANASATLQLFQHGSVVNLVSNATFNGPYKYVLWGHEA